MIAQPIARTVIATAMALASATVRAAPPPVTQAPAIKLYTLDCGRIDFENEEVFSDTGEHDGERGVMPVSCFLVRHGNQWLLWDAGLGDEIAAFPRGRVVVGLHFRVLRTLASQLSELGLDPSDITYVALSHLHADHSGNAQLFPRSTFLVSAKELAWATSEPTPEGVRADAVAAVARSHIEFVDGDRDVFGDGTVIMLGTPGHTPGHHSLMVRLANSGSVILTGDVAHFQVNYDENLVPGGNFSRAETLAAIGRVKGLAAHHHARVVIQHASNIFETLPRFPQYLN